MCLREIGTEGREKEGDRGGWGVGEEERKREADRQTDTQTDRQTDRQIDRQTD